MSRNLMSRTCVMLRTVNTKKCLQMYFCSELSQAANTCSKVARVLIQARQVSPWMMAHCLRFVVVGRRSLMDLRRKLICDSSMRARIGQLSFYCSDSPQHDQAHCLANPTAVADLLSLSIARFLSMIISRRPLVFCAENQQCSAVYGNVLNIDFSNEPWLAAKAKQSVARLKKHTC